MKFEKNVNIYNWLRFKHFNRIAKMKLPILFYVLLAAGCWQALSQTTNLPSLPSMPARIPRINTNAPTPRQSNTVGTAIKPSTNVTLNPVLPRTTTMTNISGVPQPTNVIKLPTATTNPAAKPVRMPLTSATPTNLPPTRTMPAGAPTAPGVPGIPGPGAPTVLPTVPLTSTATNPETAMATNVPSGKTGQDNQTFKPGLLRFQAQDLSGVLDLYALLVNKTILRPAVLPDVKITIKNQTELNTEEAIRAINALLAMNGVTLIDVDDKFVKVVPETDVFKQAKPFSSSEVVTNMPDLAPYVTVVRQVTNAKPSEVVQALQPFAKIQNGIIGIDSSQILIIRDYADNVKRMIELLDKIDVSIPLEIEPVVIPIKYAKAADMAQVISSLTAGGGGGTTVGSQTGGKRGTTSTRGLGFGSRTGFGTSGMTGYNQPGTTPGTPLGTTPGAAQSSFTDRLKSIVSKASAVGELQIISQAKIIADERTNSLLIFADKRDMEMITNIIAKLDVVLAQVLIESLIMEVQLNNNSDYGLSFQQRKPTQIGNFTGIGSIINGTVLNPGSFSSGVSNAAASLSGFSYFGRFSQDLDVTATAIANDSRYNVISRPRIMTTHATDAYIFVGETRPYITGSYNALYYGGSGYSQYDMLQIGITLTVTPYITSDGIVAMDIEQEIANVGGSVKIDNNDVPITVNRNAKAYVVVKDRETVILGGYITSDITKASSGVPILKDIPLLGILFKNNSSKKNRSELIVLIKPTVLPTPEIAAKATEEQKNLLPGVKRAERDEDALRKQEAERYEREYQNKLLKKSKKEEFKSETQGNDF